MPYTSFIFNLTFNSEKLSVLNSVELEIKLCGFFFDNYKNTKLEFNEKNNMKIPESSFISRTNYSRIENLITNNIKFNFDLDKNTSYETNILSYKLYLINIFYNLDFKISNSKDDCFLALNFKKTRLYEFCRIIESVKSQSRFWSNFDKKLIYQKMQFYL